jgi:hypothetical protein
LKEKILAERITLSLKKVKYVSTYICGSKLIGSGGDIQGIIPNWDMGS